MQLRGQDQWLTGLLPRRTVNLSFRPSIISFLGLVLLSGYPYRKKILPHGSVRIKILRADILESIFRSLGVASCFYLLYKYINMQNILFQLLFKQWIMLVVSVIVLWASAKQLLSYLWEWVFVELALKFEGEDSLLRYQAWKRLLDAN